MAEALGLGIAVVVAEIVLGLGTPVMREFQYATLFKRVRHTLAAIDGDYFTRLGIGQKIKGKTHFLKVELAQHPQP